MLVSYGAGMAWTAISPRLGSIKLPVLGAMADAVMPKPTDGTSINGLTRKVTWSASQEEDLIDAAVMSLPASDDGKITAASYLVKDLSQLGTVSGSTLSRDPDRVMPIASITKLVTAAVAKQLIPVDDKVSITAAITATYGNTAGFRGGESFRAGDLLYPLLMVSSNDAAEALAQHYGRSKFIAAMNGFVQSIGAYRTYFADPSGLSPDNVSTADDIALIIEWLRQNDPDIISITQLKSKTMRDHTWTNPTHFLSWSNYAGGKNGYTPEADRTGVSLFTLGRSKDMYAVVVLGSESRDTDEIKLLRKVAY